MRTEAIHTLLTLRSAPTLGTPLSCVYAHKRVFQRDTLTHWTLTLAVSLRALTAPPASVFAHHGAHYSPGMWSFNAAMVPLLHTGKRT